MVKTIIGKVGTVYKGDWSATDATYNRLDEVTYEGSTYRVILPTGFVPVGTLPTNTTYFKVSAKGVDASIYTPSFYDFSSDLDANGYLTTTGTTVSNAGFRVSKPQKVKTGSTIKYIGRTSSQFARAVIGYKLDGSFHSILIGEVADAMERTVIVPVDVDTVRACSSASFTYSFKVDASVINKKNLPTDLVYNNTPGNRLLTQAEATTISVLPVAASSSTSFGVTISDAQSQVASTSLNYCIVVSPVGMPPATVRQKAMNAVIHTAESNGQLALVVMRKLNVSSDVYTEVKRYPFETTIGNNTYDLTSLNAVSQVGDYWAFARINQAVKFKTRTTANAGLTAGYGTPTTYINPNGLFEFIKPTTVNNLAYNMSLTVDTSVDNITNQVNNLAVSLDNTAIEAQKNKTEIANNKAEITAVKELAGKVKISNNRTSLFKDKFTAISSEYVAQSATWNVVAGGISPTAIGLNNSIALKRNYALSEIEYRVLVNLKSGNRFVLNAFVDANDNTSTSASNSMVEFDVNNNKVILYNGYKSDNILQPVLAEYPYTFVAGRDYVLSINVKSREFTSSLTIIDTVAGVATLVYTDYSNIRRWTDYISFATLAGVDMVVKSLYIDTIIPVGAHSGEWGDSLVKGTNTPLLPGEGRANLLANYIGDGSFYSGRPSGMIYGVRQRLQTEAAILKPKWIILSIGTNNTTSQINSQYAAMLAEALAITPNVIINNVPAKGGADASESLAKNTTLANLRATNNLQGVKFDVATSVNNDPTLGPNSALQPAGDSTHFNKQGNIAMFNRYFVDTPDLFY